MSRLKTLSPVIDVFSMLFSNLWIGQWQRRWPERLRRLKPKAPSPKGSSKKKKPHQGHFYRRIFSLRVTLWYLIFQRLSFDQTQTAVMVDVRAGGADSLGRVGRKKISSQVKSVQASAYNQARQRMPLEFLQDALVYLGQKVSLRVGLLPQANRKPEAAQRTRQLLDGSTIGLLKTPELAATYPPTKNHRGASDWCLMRIVVGFCARSGMVLSAIEAAASQSEQKLCWKLLERARAWTIWIGDRNFGVWSVAAQAVRYRQDVLVRMTRSRANRLCQGRPMVNGEDRRVEWLPSRHDQCAEGTVRKAISGRLIYLRFCRNGTWIDLYLFTTLDASEYPLELLIKWYGERWQAELNFRYVKTQLEMEELQVTTPAMARKEFYVGLIAYGLVRAVLWEAGDRLEEKVKTLSFSQARRVLIVRLQEWGRKPHSGAKHAMRWVRRLLEEVQRHTLPKRKKPRPNEVRRVRHRRQKFPPLRGTRAASRSSSMAKHS